LEDVDAVGAGYCISGIMEGVPPWRPSKRTLKFGLDSRKDFMRGKLNICFSMLM